MPEPRSKGRGGRNRRNKKYQKPAANVAAGMKKLSVNDNSAPKAPEASSSLPEAKNFSPEESALRNLLSEVVAKCNGKKVEEDGATAITAFSEALTTSELVVSSDVTSIIVDELLKSKSAAAREAGCKIVSSIAKKKLLLLGFDQHNGARPMARVIQEKIKIPLAELLLKNSKTKGEVKVDFDTKSDKFKISIISASKKEETVNH